MTDQELFAVLDAVMPTRVFRLLVPNGIPEPYTVYQRTWQEPTNSLCGYENLDKVLYRIDSYGKSNREAFENMQAMKEALRACPDPPNVGNEQDLYEQDTRLHRVTIMIITWDQPQQVTA
jgi:hypothetical protein